MPERTLTALDGDDKCNVYNALIAYIKVLWRSVLERQMCAKMAQATCQKDTLSVQ
jgi:hypothetical protein